MPAWPKLALSTVSTALVLSRSGAAVEQPLILQRFFATRHHCKGGAGADGYGLVLRQQHDRRHLAGFGGETAFIENHEIVAWEKRIINQLHRSDLAQIQSRALLSGAFLLYPAATLELQLRSLFFDVFLSLLH